MPTKLYDADGNEVEAFLPDEVKPLQEAAALHDKELAETKEKLTKLENKDFNFKKMRDMTQAEIEKLSAKEIELMKRQENLEEQQTTFKQQVVQSHMNDALAVLAGEDEEVRKKIMHNYERINDDATTKEDIFRKMKDAYRLTTDRSVSMNPLSAAMGVVGNAPAKGDNKVWSDDLKELGSKMGLKEDDMKK
jgi:chromosome segregation ATPase